MTLISPEPPPAGLAAPPPGTPGSGPGAVSVPSRVLERAAVTIATHTGVDYLSFVAIAIMPTLALRADMTKAQTATLLAIGSLASGGIQPVAAWLTDRFDSRLLAVFGVVLAALSIPAVGLATSFPMLAVLFGLGAMGVGAFHPPAAASIGALAGARRSMGVALFFLAGMFGGIGGNMLTPVWARQWGLTSLLWLALPSLALAAVLAWAIARVPHRAQGAHQEHAALPRDERRARRVAIGLLYAGNVVRFAVNQALVFLVIEWLERVAASRAAAGATPEQIAEHASSLNGPMQAAMQVGMGLTGLAAGAWLSARWEKAALVVTPLLGAAAVVAMPLAGDHLALGFVLIVLTGQGFGGLVPVTIAMAQRLLPHRTGLASGLMMGGAWMFAGVGAFVAERTLEAFGFDAAFWATGGMLVLCAALSALLPAAAARTAREER